MKERLTFPSDGEQGLEISCNFAGVKYDEQMENQSITKIQVRPLQIEDTDSWPSRSVVYIRTAAMCFGPMNR